MRLNKCTKLGITSVWRSSQLHRQRHDAKHWVMLTIFMRCHVTLPTNDSRAKSERHTPSTHIAHWHHWPASCVLSVSCGDCSRVRDVSMYTNNRFSNSMETRRNVAERAPRPHCDVYRVTAWRVQLWAWPPNYRPELLLLRASSISLHVAQDCVAYCAS